MAKIQQHNYGQTIRRLWRLVTRGNGVKLSIVFVLLLISAISGTIVAVALKYLFDNGITPLIGQLNPDFSPLITIIIILISVYTAGNIADYLYNLMMIDLTQKTLDQTRSEIFSHMQTLPLGFFDQNTHGKLMSYYTNDVDTLDQVISESIPSIIISLLTIITILIIMLNLSFYLTISVGVMLLLISKITKILGARSVKYSTQQQGDLAGLNGYIEEMLAGQKVVKSFCRETNARQEFAKFNEILCVSATKARQYAAALMPITVNLGNLQYGLTAVIGAIILVKGLGGLTLGGVISFLQLSRNLSVNTAMISQELHFVSIALAGAERIFTLLDQPAEINGGSIQLIRDNNLNQWHWQDRETNLTIPLKGRVVLDHVHFGYNPHKIILQDIDLTIEAGQKVAFVGHTGAGKTTITNLINRFYEIHQGKISLDGLDIRQIDKASLRQALGMVLQDSNLFSGTIRDNIRYGKLDATEAEIQEAARLTNADEFIRLLPEGYDTFIDGSGESLSQGQRQLLTIARVAVANPPVLILDEATSGIDTHTEALVQQGMDSLMQGRTVLVIAHRLSTIRNADTIVVLQNGCIIEKGKHQELLAQKGIYHQLYTGVLELE